jgi:hypothetical protein
MEYKHGRFNGIIICVLVVFMLVLSCRLPDFGKKPTPAAPPVVVVPTQAQPVSQTNPTISPTVPVTVEEPSATPEKPKEPANPNAKPVSYKGITFEYDKNLAQDASFETIPATADPENAAPWEITSQYEHIHLTGYVLKDTFHEADIYVYPISEYEAINERVKSEVDNLKTMLANKPGGPYKRIPFLPTWNAAQQLRVQVSYLDFKNGSGVRFLSQYGQDIGYIISKNLFYTFQGLTSDGKYYVSIILPVGHPSLPQTGNLSQDEYQKLADNYLTYINKVEQDLGSQNPSSFKPDLAVLDAVVKSLSINK